MVSSQVPRMLAIAIALAFAIAALLLPTSAAAEERESYSTATLKPADIAADIRALDAEGRAPVTRRLR